MKGFVEWWVIYKRIRPQHSVPFQHFGNGDGVLWTLGRKLGKIEAYAVFQIKIFPISIVLVIFEANQYWPKLEFWNQYPLCWRPDSDIITIVYVYYVPLSANRTSRCWVNVNFGHTLYNFQNKLTLSTCNFLVILMPWFFVMSTFPVWL